MWHAIGWNVNDAELLLLQRLKLIVFWDKQYILWLLEKNTEKKNEIYCSKNIVRVLKSKGAMSGTCSTVWNVRLLNKIVREERKRRRDLQELGRRWENIFQIDLTEIKFEILNLIQVVRMGSSGGLLFEHDKESSCLIKGGTFSPFPTTGPPWDYVNVYVVRCLDVRSFLYSIHYRHEITLTAILMYKAEFMQLVISPLLLNPEVFQNFSRNRIIWKEWLLALKGPLLCMHYFHCLCTRAGFILL
jgi:hypothetical protein